MQIDYKSSMDPKITVTDAALCLGKTKAWVLSILEEQHLSAFKMASQIYFGHETARALFRGAFKSQVIVCQIVKGGTGKTALVRELAIRASLYGARVLCIDMDQQANLTLALNQNADQLPVMIDVLADQYPLSDTILSVLPGLDLVPSRFDNTLLDQVITQKKLDLNQIYRQPFQAFKHKYDLILVDCPPSLGQSVTACALSADRLLAPVVPEKFALAGLDITDQSLKELQQSFGRSIPLSIVLNKFENKARSSQDTLMSLLRNPKYGNQLFKRNIRFCVDFSKAIAAEQSIFDSLKPSIAKDDIDYLTRELLDVEMMPAMFGAMSVSTSINT